MSVLEQRLNLYFNRREDPFVLRSGTWLGEASQLRLGCGLDAIDKPLKLIYNQKVR